MKAGYCCISLVEASSIEARYCNLVLPNHEIEQIGIANSFLQISILPTTDLSSLSGNPLPLSAYHQVREVLSSFFEEAHSQIASASVIAKTLPTKGSCFRQGQKLLSVAGTVKGTDNLCLCGFQLSKPQNFSDVISFLEPSGLQSNDYEQIEPLCYQTLLRMKTETTQRVLGILSTF